MYLLLEFPRFLNNPSLIEEDYIQEHSKINFEALFTEDAGKILHIYEKTVKNPNKIITIETISDPGWDKSTRALLALLEMLPPAPKGRNTSSNRCPLEEKLVFKAVNTTISEIILRKQTSQPFLIAQGSNKGAITQYNIIVDQKSIPCPYLCSSAKEFEMLFMSYFVFNTKYDEELKIFFEFMQNYYFKINLSDKLIPKMIELRTRLEMINNSTDGELNSY